MDSSLRNVELFLFDLDGTVYLDGVEIPGSIDTINFLKENGKKICFLTNNASRSQKEYVDRIKAMGIDVDLDQIFTAGMSTIDFLNDNYQNKKVFLLGTNSLKNEMIENGIKIVEDEPDVVVLSFDTEITYDKLYKTSRYVQEGLPYIATHPDKVCPAKEGDMPDAGAFIALIHETTGRFPDYNCGKPYKILGDIIQKRFNLAPNKIAMVGDRLYTDIQFAINNKFVSILVLTGETDLQMYYDYQSIASYVFNDLTSIKTTIQNT